MRASWGLRSPHSNREEIMYAPYTECEWNFVTHGVRKSRNLAVKKYEKTKYEMMIKEMDKKYILISKDKLILSAMSILPTIMLVVFAVLIFSK